MTDAGRVLIDTSVVSYIFNGDSPAEYYLEAIADRETWISFQTLEEVRFGTLKYGWGRRRREELERHLRQYRLVWASPELVDICAHLRRERETAGRRLNTADAWIAAAAILLDCPIATHDRDFSGIPNLEVIRAPSAW